MVITHYQLLGIPEDADSRQIKAAYRSMAKRFHPDANKGSEAAAELFRQLSEAYRVLGDGQLRKVYDRKITVQHQTQAEQPVTKRPPPPEQKQQKKPDPQQKFNNFLYSVLGAILEPPDITPEERPKGRTSPAVKPTRKVRSKPDFNFYYCLATERSANPYTCDDDGIYRRSKEKIRTSTKRSFGRVPGSSAVMLLLTGLWEVFRQ